MATIEERQRSLVSQFDSEIVYLLDGVAAKMDTAGLGQSLQHFRKGKEPTRPPAVTLEPTRTGLMLGLVISRPKGGRMVYDRTLGRWDFTVPIRPRGPLDATNAMHRRAATLQLRVRCLRRRLTGFPTPPCRSPRHPARPAPAPAPH